LPPADFWFASLREYDVQTRGRIKAKNAEIDAQRVLNQEMANLFTFAFHDPKKMPDYTKAGARKSSPKLDQKHAVEKLRAGLMSLHFQSKKGR